MSKAILFDGIRSPFLKAGTIPDLSAVTLGSHVLRHLVEKYNLRGTSPLVIGANIGNQLLHPDGSNVTRYIALASGLSQATPALTVNINCASGLEAVIQAAMRVEAGINDVVWVVGVEVMSDYLAVYNREQRGVHGQWLAASKEKKWWKKYPRLLSLWWKTKTMPHAPIWALEKGLTDPFVHLKMDQIADAIANDKEYGSSKEEQDLFALQSHQRASKARASGRLAKEILPFGKHVHDNGIRDNQTLDDLKYKTKPIYKGGTTSAGNSSQLTDGAVALLIVSEEVAQNLLTWQVDSEKERKRLPMAEISAKFSGYAGCDPARMGIGPVGAVKDVLNKMEGVSLENFDLIETNEAFASVVLAQKKLLEKEGIGYLDLDNKVNVNGGAIALGHPLAASGTRLALTCAMELQLRNLNRGLVTLCVGGGQGVALPLERRTL